MSLVIMTIAGLGDRLDEEVDILEFSGTLDL
jgi:hypothetical protein